MEFYKYQGTGNDFILIDNRNASINLSTQQIHNLCDRRFGIGADGLMLLNPSNESDFKMVYYNSDGLESTMCGNGGRCIVAFAKAIGIDQIEFIFEAIDGIHHAHIKHDIVHLQMQNVGKINNENAAYVLNTGSPHYIIQFENLQDLDVFGRGIQIRNSETYKKEGINVNFVEKQEDFLFVRTFERGVEAETLSCGTGVTASAIALSPICPEPQIVKIKTLGGHLKVQFTKPNGESAHDIWLIGPATFVFKGEI